MKNLFKVILLNLIVISSVLAQQDPTHQGDEGGGDTDPPEMCDTQTPIQEWVQDSCFYSLDEDDAQVDALAAIKEGIWCIGSPGTPGNKPDRPTTPLTGTSSNTTTETYETCCVEADYNGQITIMMKFIFPTAILNNAILEFSGENYIPSDNHYRACWESETNIIVPGCSETNFSYTYFPLDFSVSGCGLQEIELCFNLYSTKPPVELSGVDLGELDLFDGLDPCLIPPGADGNCLTYQVNVCCTEVHIGGDGRLDHGTIALTSPSYSPASDSSNNDADDMNIEPRNTFSPVTIFPNPVDDMLTISNAASVTNYKIINAEGRIVLENEQLGQDRISLATQELLSGLYLLIYEENQELKTTKFVKN